MTQENQNQATQQPVQQVAVSQNAAALKKFQEETANNVLERVNAMTETGELVLPEHYHAGNAVRLAWLYLQTVKDKNFKPAVDVCTKESIRNCFLEMIIKGLSVAKKQCYFIVAGNQLTFWEDYGGKLMRAKRDTDIKDVFPQVVYAGDEFVYSVDELGQYQLVRHSTKMENIKLDKIVGAYAVVVRKDDTRYLELMTMEQIRNAWLQGAAGGKSKAHTNFTDQMCKKTVTSRACKVALRAAEDEFGESDTATQQRNAAQDGITDAPQAQDAEFIEVEDGAEAMVDVTTGEVISPEAETGCETNKCPI